MTHILLFYNDIQKYPPIVSLIESLLGKKHKIVILGYCSGDKLKKKFKENDIVYHELIKDNTKASPISKFYKLFKYKKKALSLIKKYYKENSRVWVFSERNAWILHTLFLKYKVILYLFEVPAFSVELRFRLLSPFASYSKIMKLSHRVICCEYNRAYIVKSYFGLEELPLVIPNKPLIKEEEIADISTLKQISKDLYNVLISQKVILYQGIFNYPERRLDELCESIGFLPEEFHLVLMGEDSCYKKELYQKYEGSDRIHFIDRIDFPDHLAITKLAYIGFLSYQPSTGDIINVLNTLYCAPNKIYEYALFNKPMLAVQNPALSYNFKEFSMGVSIDKIDEEEICKAIWEIEKKYNTYSKGAQCFYSNTDIENLFIKAL